jgi:hypothetical protein
MGIPSGDIDRNFCTEYNFKSTSGVFPIWKLQDGEDPPGEIFQSPNPTTVEGLVNTMDRAKKVKTIPDGCMVFSVPSNFAFDVSKDDMRYWQDMVNTQAQTRTDGSFATVGDNAYKGKQLYKFLEKVVEDEDDLKLHDYESWYKQSTLTPHDPAETVDTCRALYPQYIPICRAGRQFFNGWTPESNPVQLPKIVPASDPDAGETVINQPAIPKAHSTRLYDYPDAGFTRNKVSSGKINVAVWYHIMEDMALEQNDVKKGYNPLTQNLAYVGVDSGRTLIPIGIQVLPTSGDHPLVPHTTFDDAKILNAQMTGNSVQDTVFHRTGLKFNYDTPAHAADQPGNGGPGYNLGPTCGEPMTNIYGWAGETLPDGCRIPTRSTSEGGWKTQVVWDTQKDGTSRNPLLGPINWPFTQNSAQGAGALTNFFKTGVPVAAVCQADMEVSVRAEYQEDDMCYDPAKAMPSRHVGGGFKLNPTNQVPGLVQGMYLRWGQVQRFIRGFPVREGDIYEGMKGESKQMKWEASGPNASDGGISIRDNFKFNYATDAYDGGMSASPSNWKDLWGNYTKWESYFNRYPQVTGSARQSNAYCTFQLNPDGMPSGQALTNYPHILRPPTGHEPVDLKDVKHLRFLYGPDDLQYFNPTVDHAEHLLWQHTHYDIPWCFPLPTSMPIISQALYDLDGETHALAQEIKDIETIEDSPLTGSVRFEDADALEEYIISREARWSKAINNAAREDGEIKEDELEAVSPASSAFSSVAPRPLRVMGRISNLETCTHGMPALEQLRAPHFDRRVPKPKVRSLHAIMEEQLRLDELRADPGHFRTALMNGLEITDLDNLMQIQKRHCITTANIVYTAGEATGLQTPTDNVDLTVGKNLGIMYESVNIRETQVTKEMYWPGPSFGVPICNPATVQRVAQALCLDRARVPGKSKNPGYPLVKKGHSFWNIAKKGWGFLSSIVDGANTVKVVVDDMFLKAPGGL